MNLECLIDPPEMVLSCDPSTCNQVVKGTISAPVEKFRVMVQFKEAVVGFDLSMVKLTFSDNNLSGILGPFETIDERRGFFAVEVQEIRGEGYFYITVNGDQVRDLAGNAGSNMYLEILRDTVPPPPPAFTTSIADDKTTTNLEAFTVFVDFHEAVAGLQRKDFQLTLDNSSASAQLGALLVVDIEQGRFRMDVTNIIGQTTLILGFLSGSATDYAGNLVPASSISIVHDTISPDPPILVSSRGKFTQKTDTTITISFSKPVVGFTQSDLHVAKSAGSAQYWVIGMLVPLSNNLFRLEVRQMSGEGFVEFSFDEGAAVDLAGNPAPGGSITVTRDLSPLSAPRLSAGSLKAHEGVWVTAASSINVTVDFGEQVTGLQASNLIFEPATGAQLMLRTIDELKGLFVVTISPIVGQFTFNFTVPEGACFDLAGNTGPSASLLFTRDTTPPPLARMISSEGVRTNANKFVVDIDFGERVLGFNDSVLEITKDPFVVVEKGDLKVVDAARGKYSIPLFDVGGTMVGDQKVGGNIKISFSYGAVTDVVGNAAPVAYLIVTWDPMASSKPRLECRPCITSIPYATFLITFLDAVTGFEDDDLYLVLEEGLQARLQPLKVIDQTTGSYSVGIEMFNESGTFTLAFDEGSAEYTKSREPVPRGSVSVVRDTTPPAPPSLEFKGIGNSYGSRLVTNQASFDISIDFHEPVLGFQLSDVLLYVEGGSAQLDELRDEGGGLYTLTLEGVDGEGTVEVSFAEGAATDLALNLAPPGKLTVYFDTLAPAAPKLHIDKQFNFTKDSTFDLYIDVGEEIFDFKSIMVRSVTRGVFGGIADIQTIDDAKGLYMLKVTNLVGNGYITIIFPDGIASDAARNPTPAASIQVWRDTLPPEPVISSPQGTLNNAKVVDITVDFGEKVIGFTLSDLELSILSKGNEARLGELMILDDNKGLYAFTVEWIGDQDGTFSIWLPAGRVHDRAGNAARSGRLVVTRDTRPPKTPLFTSDVGLSTNQNAATITINFRERVLGCNESALILNFAGGLKGSPPQNFRIVDEQAGVYAVEINDLVGEGTFVLQYKYGSVTDLALNPAPKGSVQVVRDVTPPITKLWTDSMYTRANEVTLYMDYGEKVKGLSSSDLQAIPVEVKGSSPFVVVPTIGALIPGDRSGLFSVRISNMEMEGLYVIPQPRGVTDLAGNVATSHSSLKVYRDTSVPGPPLLASDKGNITNALYVTITVAFAGRIPVESLSSKHFRTEPAVITIGDIKNIFFNVWEVRVSLADLSGKGSIEISGRESQIVDVVGNAIPPASLTIVRDTRRPNPPELFTDLRSSVTNRLKFTLFLLFDEQVTWVGQMRLEGRGSIGAAVELSELPRLNSSDTLVDTIPTPIHPQTLFAAEVTLREDGEVSLLFPLGAALDLAGNRALPARIRVTRDSVPPANITIMCREGAGPTNSRRLTFDIIFGERVLNFNILDLLLDRSDPDMGGNLTSLQAVDVERGTYSVSVIGIEKDGVLTLSFPRGAATDQAGNMIDTTSAVVTVDVTPPTAFISSNRGLFTSEDNATITLSYNELVTLVNSKGPSLHVSVGSGISAQVGLLILGEHKNEYKFDIAEIRGEGVFRVIILAGATVDLAGNPSEEQSFQFTRDTTPPSAPFISSQQVKGDPPLTNAQNIHLDLNFLESIIGLRPGDVTVEVSDSVTVADVQPLQPVNFTDGRYKVSLYGIRGEGLITVSVAPESYRDAAGNNGPGGSWTVRRDETGPIVSLSTQRQVTNAEQITISVQLTEQMTAFNQSLIDLQTQAELKAAVDPASFAVVERTLKYAFTIRMSGEGRLIVRFSRGVFEDAAGNLSPPTSIEVFRDLRRPVPVLTSSEGLRIGSKQKQLTVYIEFGEEVEGFTGETLRLSLTNQTTATLGPVERGRGGSYSVDLFDVEGEGSVLLSLAAGSATNEAGNFATEASITIVKDLTSPEPPVFRCPSGDQTDQDSLILLLEFNEVVIRPSSRDLRVTSAERIRSIPNVEVGSIGTEGKQTILRVTRMVEDGEFQLELPDGVVKDIVGNPAPGGNVTFVRDTVFPGPLKLTWPAFTNSSTAVVVIEMPEPMKTLWSSRSAFSGPVPLCNGDWATDVQLSTRDLRRTMQLSNGVVKDVKQTSAVRFEVYIASLSTEGIITLTVGFTEDLMDLAGNSVDWAVASIYRDITRPSPVMTPDERHGRLTNQDILTFWVDFQESVSGVSVSNFEVFTRGLPIAETDFRYLNTTVSLETEDASLGRYSITLNVAGVADGEVQVSFVPTWIVDLAGNLGLPSEVIILRDTAPPQAPTIWSETAIGRRNHVGYLNPSTLPKDARIPQSSVNVNSRDGISVEYANAKELYIFWVFDEPVVLGTIY